MSKNILVIDHGEHSVRAIRISKRGAITAQVEKNVPSYFHEGKPIQKPEEIWHATRMALDEIGIRDSVSIGICTNTLDLIKKLTGNKLDITSNVDASKIYGTTIDGIPISSITTHENASLFAHGFHPTLIYNTTSTVVTLTNRTHPGGDLHIHPFTVNGSTKQVLTGSFCIGHSAMHWLQNHTTAYKTGNHALCFVPPATESPFEPCHKGGLRLGITNRDPLHTTYEAISHHVADIVEAMEHPTQTLFVDCARFESDVLLQMQADYLGIPLHLTNHSSVIGSAFLAGLATGFFAKAPQIPITRSYFPRKKERHKEKMKWQETIFVK